MKLNSRQAVAIGLAAINVLLGAFWLVKLLETHGQRKPPSVQEQLGKIADLCAGLEVQGYSNVVVSANYVGARRGNKYTLAYRKELKDLKPGETIEMLDLPWGLGPEPQPIEIPKTKKEKIL